MATNQYIRRQSTTYGNIVAKGKAQDLSLAQLKEALDNPTIDSEGKRAVDNLMYLSSNIKGGPQYFKNKEKQTKVRKMPT